MGAIFCESRLTNSYERHVIHVGRGVFLGVSHGIAYFTHASRYLSAVAELLVKNKNLCGRDGRTICGPQCVPKSTSVTLVVDEKTLPMATITGRTDRQTDRQSATQYAAPS